MVFRYMLCSLAGELVTDVSEEAVDSILQTRWSKNVCRIKISDADKSLARPRRKQAAPVKSVMGRGVD